MANSPSSLVNTSLPSRGPGRLAVLLVLLTAVTTTLAIAGVAVYSWYGEIQYRVETTHPAVLEWSVESVRERLDDARLAVAQLARASARDASDTARLQRAREFASSSRTFSGVVLLDEEGNLRGSSGEGVSFDSLLGILATKSALQTDLADALRAAQLRQELATFTGAPIRLFALDADRAVVIASAELVNPRGGARGSVHGLLRSSELATALRVDLLGVGGIHLAGKEGRIVAQAGDVMDAQGPLPVDTLHASATPRINVPWNAHEAWTLRSARPVGALEMAIVVEQPTLLAFESMFVASVQMAVAGGVVAAIFTLIASLMAVSLTRRLQALLDGIRSISKSDFAFRLPENGPRGQLSLIYRGFNEMANHLTQLRSQLDRSLETLSKQNVGFRQRHDELAKLSVTDGLTQLHNHRFFQDQLGREIKRLNRNNAQKNDGLCILIIDIDDFKKLNDTYGHAAGDEFLKQLARILKESVRETDVVARYGGEEFVIIAVGCTLDGARVFAEKLCERVAKTRFIVDKSMRPRNVTVTIGVAEYSHSRSELFTAADAALYRGKAAGKNRVVVADPHDKDDEGARR